MHALMAPGGMGEIFKVLLLTRGTPASRLTGARDPFRSGAVSEDAA
jgi:SAM-dependent MidA family methyltransferase